jgi:L-rhamnose mutarotase
MKRVGVTIGLRKECLEEYKRIHVKLWPEIEGAIKEAGITNYSIYYVDGQLFGYFEYTGPDQEYAARMRRLAEAPRMREWWNITEPMQITRSDRRAGDWWTQMEEVFHLD